MSDVAVQLVCFDLGGVVIRICRCWAEGCERAGVEVRGMEQRAATAHERRRIVTEYQKGLIDCDTFARSIIATLGGIYSADEIMAVHRAWTIDDYAGVGEFIDHLHTAGLRTACLSNTNHTHWEIIQDSRALQKIQTHLASHHMQLHKPEPAIYAAAQQRFDVPANAIVFFDDLPENVTAAREAGWHAFQIDHAGDTAAQMRAHLSALGVSV